jgi:hypothetical protein
MRGVDGERLVKLDLRGGVARVLTGSRSERVSLAGAVGAVGNAEPHPAFSKGCGKGRASQRGFP